MSDSKVGVCSWKTREVEPEWSAPYNQYLEWLSVGCLVLRRRLQLCWNDARDRASRTEQHEIRRKRDRDSMNVLRRARSFRLKGQMKVNAILTVIRSSLTVIRSILTVTRPILTPSVVQADGEDFLCCFLKKLSSVFSSSTVLLPGLPQPTTHSLLLCTF